MTETIARDVAARDGTRLRVWERVPPAADGAVLFVHGGTYSSRSVYDPPIEGRYGFWFDAVEASGRAALCLDVRGYGDSEKPPEMAAPPEANDPVVPTTTAADDLEDALAFVRGRFDRVHLVGWSWGTMICGLLAARSDPEVASVTMYAPVYEPPWDREALEARSRMATSGAYQVITREDALARWDGQVPDGVSPSRFRGGNDRTDPVFEAVWAEVHRSEGVEGEDAIAAPLGAVADVLAAVDGNPVYDAGDVTVPTLVVRGTHDTDSVRADALGLYDALGCRDDRKSYVEIAPGTHMLAMEAKRDALFEAVRAFQTSLAA